MGLPAQVCGGALHGRRMAPMPAVKPKTHVAPALVIVGFLLCMFGVFGPDASGQLSVLGVPGTVIVGLGLLVMGSRTIKPLERDAPALADAAGPPKGGRAEALLLVLIALPLLNVIFFAVTRSPVALLYSIGHGALKYMWPVLVLMVLAAAVVVGLIVLVSRHGKKLPRVLMDIIARRKGAAVALMIVLYLGTLILFAPSLFR